MFCDFIVTNRPQEYLFFLKSSKASPYYLKAKHKKTCHRSCCESYYAAEEMTGLLCLLLYSLILIPTKISNLRFVPNRHFPRQSAI